MCPLKVFLFFSLLTGALTLSCYDCGPDTDGPDCLKPKISHVKQCTGGEICMSYYYFSVKPKSIGAYRSCTPNNFDCAQLNQQDRQRGLILNCTTCITDNCNSRKFTNRGDVIPEYSPLTCYHCNPNNTACLNLNGSIPKQTCTVEDFNAPRCYSYYIKSADGNYTGAYRGCAQSLNNQRDPCHDFIVTSYQNQHIIANCSTCDSNNCNNIELKHLENSANFNNNKGLDFILFFVILFMCQLLFK